jgi:hypothetical protein
MDRSSSWLTVDSQMLVVVVGLNLSEALRGRLPDIYARLKEKIGRSWAKSRQFGGFIGKGWTMRLQINSRSLFLPLNNFSRMLHKRTYPTGELNFVTPVDRHDRLPTRGQQACVPKNASNGTP